MGAGRGRRRVHRRAGVYLSGLDLSREVEAYRLRLQALGLAPTLLVDNDVFALLRAGTRAPDAVAVVCGTGINAVGRRADGAVVRFPALGSISGDWGGGDRLGHGPCGTRPGPRTDEVRARRWWPRCARSSGCRPCSN